jgi:hypothetical protein
MHAFVLFVTMVFLAGCGGKVLDLGNDALATTPRYATPETVRAEADAPRGTPTVIATGQSDVCALAVDATRVYWSTTGYYYEASPEEAFVRSCEKDNCAATVVTYASAQATSCRIAVDSARVYWPVEEHSPEGLRAIVACPIAGCSHGPEIVAQSGEVVDIAVDETSLYWIGASNQLFKCSLSDCRNSQIPLAPLEHNPSGVFEPGRLGVGSTHIYWVEGDASGSIMMIPKDGSLPARALVTDLHFPKSLAMTETTIFWREYFSVGEIRSCALPDCAGGPSLVASRQAYSNLLGVEKGSAYWFKVVGQSWTSAPGVPTELFECSEKGCGSSPDLLLTDWKNPSAIAVDRTHVYWTSYGEPREPRSCCSDAFHDGTVQRLLRRK